MHLIRLNVKDSSFDKVISFLKELPQNEIEILEDIKIPADKAGRKFKAISIKTGNFRFDRDKANAR
jgi:hypothetical protein